MVGAIAGLMLVVATFLSINFSVYLDKLNEVHRAVMLYDVLFMAHPSKEEFEAYRQKHKLTPVAGEQMEQVRNKGEALIQDPLLRKTLQSGDIEIFIYNDHYYYAYKMDTMFYYRSDEPMTPYKLYIFITSSILLFLLLVLFRFISSSIRPLKDLYIQIKRFANGERNIHIQVHGTDEVAQVANAFDESVKKTQALQNSRSLFLRNVMHELKTPISKGKILINFLEGEEKDKLLLENLFLQMQGYLDDLVRVESLTDKSLELNKRTYALVDILDHAIDMLDIERKDLTIYLEDTLINVDFKLFSYAIKNLLDNALKYAQQKPIIVNVEKNRLTISNKGNPFQKDIVQYFNAYERDLTQHSLEGMGLGLYIVNEIVTRHHFKIEYKFFQGMHHFSICF